MIQSLEWSANWRPIFAMTLRRRTILSSPSVRLMGREKTEPNEMSVFGQKLALWSGGFGW